MYYIEYKYYLPMVINNLSAKELIYQNILSIQIYIYD